MYQLDICVPVGTMDLVPMDCWQPHGYGIYYSKFAKDQLFDIA